MTSERADDLLGGRIRRLIGVDLDHIRPPRQRISQSLGVVTVDLKPVSDRLLGVIRSGAPFLGTVPQSPDEDVRARLKPHDKQRPPEPVHARQRLPQRSRLAGGSRIPVEDGPLVGAEHLEALAYEPVDELIVDQLPGGHPVADLAADRGLAGGRFTQDLPRVDMGQAETPRESGGLGSLALRAAQTGSVARADGSSLVWS